MKKREIKYREIKYSHTDELFNSKYDYPTVGINKKMEKVHEEMHIGQDFYISNESVQGMTDDRRNYRHFSVVEVLDNFVVAELIGSKAATRECFSFFDLATRGYYIPKIF